MRITAIVQQERVKQRYSIYIDGAFAFGLSESALLESGLASGQELDGARVKALQRLSADDKAYGLALRYVTMRPRSVWEMSQYLKRKAVTAEVQATILRKLENLGLLSDVAFAQSWVQSRRILKPTSRRKLELELKQKHVPPSVIDDVLRVDAEETDEVAVLRNLIERKRSRYADEQKLMAYLARQGYRYDDIKRALQDDSI